MNRGEPPRADEFEISVIGPGRGECIILHLGNNNWCVVDSCIGPGSSESAAAEYLSLFGDDALEGVRLLLATHWHDDHIRGIASALKRFPNAEFCSSVAISTPQFATLVQLQTKALQGDSGVDEFAKIMEVLLERKAKRDHKYVSPKFALVGRPVFHIAGEEDQYYTKITCLSPSDGTVKIALEQIAALIPQPGTEQRRIPSLTPNSSSIVLWVEAGSRRALLGADLEHSSSHEIGWFAVLRSSCDSKKANFFKVPHHGSPNADCPEVWQTLLEPNPVAVVTPFTSGQGLPQESDLKRLKTRTPEAYCTAIPPKKGLKRESVVEKMLSSSDRRVVDGHLGQVRLRVPLMGDDVVPTIDLFHNAFKVQ